MKPFWRSLLFLFLLVKLTAVQGQNNITGFNGYDVPATTIPGDPQCVYEWTNDNPSIGLPASGIGNSIPTFTAVNNGTKNITAHLTATPLPSGFAYIARVQEATVSVVSVAALKVVAEIPVGAMPGGIEISADGSRVYVANWLSGTISIINTLDNTVTRTIELGPIRPAQIKLSKDESKLYIQAPGGVFVLDLSSSTIVQTLWFNYAGPIRMIVSRDESKIYVLFQHTTRNMLAEIDRVSLTITKIIDLATSPTDMCETIDGKGLYIIGLKNDLILMNTTTYELTTRTTRAENRNIHMSKDGKLLYISHGLDNTVTIVDTEHFEVLKTYAINREAGYIEVTRDGRFIFVLAGTRDNDVTVINVNTGALTRIPIGVWPASSGHFIKGGIDCEPSTFTVTIKPTPTAIINNSNTLAAVNTMYGTPSAATSFTVSGIHITTEGILVTPPNGFEVSLDNSNFSGTVTVAGTGNLTPVTVYIRLAGKTHTGTYDGDIILSNDNAVDSHIPVPSGTVIKADLKIAADDIKAFYSDEKPVFTFSYTGFVNADGPAQLNTLPVATGPSERYPLPGVYIIKPSGAEAADYNLSYQNGMLTILEGYKDLIIPNAFTPNGDGINDTWDIKYLNTYSKATVSIFNRNGQQVYFSNGYINNWDGNFNGRALPAGTYYYFINLNNKKPNVRGSITIIR